MTDSSTVPVWGDRSRAPTTQLTSCHGPLRQDSRIDNATWKMAHDMTGGSSGGNWVDRDPTTFSSVLRSDNSYGHPGDELMYRTKFNTRTAAVYNAANTGAITNTRVTGG